MTQDLKNKNQITKGYLQLLKETQLTKEQYEYIKKAIQASSETNEILKLTKEFEKTKKNQPYNYNQPKQNNRRDNKGNLKKS